MQNLGKISFLISSLKLFQFLEYIFHATSAEIARRRHSSLPSSEFSYIVKLDCGSYFPFHRPSNRKGAKD